MGKQPPFQRKLKALKYGDWKTFDINNRQNIQTLVVWLEQTRIREYKVEDRDLLKDTNSRGWNQTFEEYLNALESPYHLNYTLKNDTKKADKETLREIESEWAHIIDWLLSQAIFREYSDNKLEFNQRKPIRRKDKKVYQLEKCSTKEMNQALEELCKFLNIPMHPTDNAITCSAIATFIKDKFNPMALKNYEEYLKEKTKEEQNKTTNISDPWKEVQNYEDIIRYYGNTLGFETGDQKVDAAAIILKALYLLDARSAQNQFSEIITFLQRFTADPKTNTGLGKVGW